MQEDGSILISEFQKGVGQSAFLGTESIIGCDITDTPGILKIKEAPQKGAELINTVSHGLCVAKAIDNNGVTFYVSDTSLIAEEITWQSNFTQGCDVAVWNDSFTIVSYQQSGTGYIGIYSSTSKWSPAKIGGLTGTHYIKLLMGQDGYCYFTNGQYVGRITNISESAGVITVTSTSNALDLNKGVYAVTLAELGANLLIGTQRGSVWSSKGNYSGANIYPWDRVSSSFRLPVQLRENGINAMLQKDNLVYVSAGKTGNVYVTDGTTYRLIKTLPFSKVKKFGPTCNVYPNAMCIDSYNNLLIATSTYEDATPNNLTKHGVWEISLANDYATSLAYTSRTGELGNNNPVYFGYVIPQTGSTISYSTKIGTTYEMLITDFRKNTNYTASYESQVYIVGSRSNRKTFQKLEFALAEPLIDGQGIKISYRKRVTDAYTLIGTYDFTTLGSVISHTDKALIADAEMVQVKIQLTQNSSTVFPSNLNLINVRIS